MAPKITNTQIVDSLWSATEEDRIEWQPTGTQDQFSTSLEGRWTVVIDKSSHPHGELHFWIELKDSEGESILRITEEQNPNLPDLFEMARRQALKIDKRLTDFLSDLNKPQDNRS